MSNIFSLRIILLQAGMFLIVLAANPAPLNARCPDNTIVDTIFVLENNPPSGADNWSKMFQFFLDVIGQFKLGSVNARFGIPNLNGNYARVIDLLNLNNVTAVDKFLRPRTDLNLLTYTDKAFTNIKDLNMFGSSTGGRQSARRKIVLITDGKSSDLQKTLSLATTLKSSGIQIITIGIGNGVQKDELLAIASTNLDTYFVSSYDQLADYRAILINKICYATPAPLTARCPDNTIIDTIFVLENNPASGAANWSKELQFFFDVIGQFKLGEGNARFGIPNLNGNYARVIDLLNLNTVASVDKFLRPRTDLNLLTYTDKAFSNIKDLNMFGSSTGGRQSARRKIVLITDGKSSDLQKTLSLANTLKNSGIHIITLGVGNGVQLDELLAIASTNLHTYSVSSYDQLADYRTPLIDKICYENTPIITATAASTAVTTTLPAAAKCTVKTPIDVVFVLQYSDNRADNWNKLVQFVVDTVGRFNLGPNDARFGSLSSKVKDPTSFDVWIYSDYSAIEKGFKGNGERKNGNFTDKALTVVSQWIVNGQASPSRTQAKTYVVLATDGKSGNIAETQKAVDLLKKQNVRLVTVGVGSGISSTELKTLASSTDDAILANTFDDLPNLKNPLFNRLCRAN